MSESSNYKTQRQTFLKGGLPLFIILSFSIAAILFVSCSDPTREQQAAAAAKEYYDHLVNVYLMLCFGDSINERVVVPMVEYKGRWVIR